MSRESQRIDKAKITIVEIHGGYALRIDIAPFLMRLFGKHEYRYYCAPYEDGMMGVTIGDTWILRSDWRFPKAIVSSYEDACLVAHELKQYGHPVTNMEFNPNNLRII